jgi:hypothetical protein
VDKTRDLKIQISDLETRITAEQNAGIQTDRARELLSSVRQDLDNKQYSSATKLLSEADEYLDRKAQSNKRITSLIAEAEKMIKTADNKGVNVVEATKSLDFSRKAMKRSDDTSAIYYAKQSQRQVKESKKQHKEAEVSLSNIKAYMYDLRDIDTQEADKIFKSAELAMVNKEYTDVLKYSKATKQKAEEISNLFKDADVAIKKVKTEVDNIKHLELDIPQAIELYNKANQTFSNHKYVESIELANQSIDLINAERGKFQNAQESVSFAKLVTSNAISFGASIPDAEKYVADAELALSQKNYDKAIDLATKAKDIAESAKRQQQRLAKRK